MEPAELGHQSTLQELFWGPEPIWLKGNDGSKGASRRDQQKLRQTGQPREGRQRWLLPPPALPAKAQQALHERTLTRNPWA